jgi:serine/threonine-protein kinase HSL1, negative regulator of Swe1 kinase
VHKCRGTCRSRRRSRDVPGPRAALDQAISFTEMNPPRAPTRRAPLGDATQRVNNALDVTQSSLDKDSPSLRHHERLIAGGLLQASEPQNSPMVGQKGISSRDCYGVVGSPGTNAANPRLSAISKEYPIPNSNRNSQISTTSTNGSGGGRRKTHIGPWHLGKTLGKGSTARVRMARHAVTGQLAAIKIVQKKDAQLSQAGSIAALDRKDAAINNSGEGPKRMPYSIEREVAIMKLIEHPHIMKLYDIWENRTEM